MLRQGFLLAALIVARCGDPVSPPGEATVDLHLRLSASQGGPGDLIVATARATNRQNDSILYFEGCSEETGVWFEVLGPDGEPVQVLPAGPRPLCADFVQSLPPRGSVGSELHFDGTLYDAQGLPYACPTGRYVFVARFRWWHAESISGTVVREQRAVLTWRRKR